MDQTISPTRHFENLDIEAYEITNIDDEIRVDALCTELLRAFFAVLTQERSLPPEDAVELCRGVDFFLREFIIGDRHENLFRLSPVRVRQFAGHWYIVRTMEPNMTELGSILDGTRKFYRLLAESGLYAEGRADEICRLAGDLAYYQERIECYWAIDDEGYEAWRAACPLESRES